MSTLACACSYPEFEFAASDTGPALVDTGRDDTSAPDTAIADTLDATPARGCGALTTTFCDDFDGITTPGARWDGAGTMSSGTLSLTSTAAFSEPQSLVAELATGIGAEIYAKVGKNLNAPTAGALTRMDVRLFIESEGFPGTKAILVKTQMTGGRGVGLLTTSSGFAIEVYGATDYTTYALPASAIPIGKWFHLRIDTELRVTGGMYKVFVDDMVTPVAERSGISTTNADAAAREFTVGLYTNDPVTGAYRVRFDDVRLDFP